MAAGLIIEKWKNWDFCMRVHGVLSFGKHDSEIEEYISHLTELIKSQKPLETDRIVYKNATFAQWFTVPVGSCFGIQKSFMATTSSQQYALSRQSIVAQTGKKVYLSQIKIPAGLSCLDIGGDESEVILPIGLDLIKTGQDDVWSYYTVIV